MNEMIRTIARRELGVETLEPRHADSLDFHTLSVWELKRALERVYEAGRNAGAADAS